MALIESAYFFVCLETTEIDGKDSEDSSGPIVAGIEDSSEATNDSISAAIHSEETSREAALLLLPATNGNGGVVDGGDDNANDVPRNGAPAQVDDEDDIEQPSSKKIRLATNEEGATA